MGRENIGRFKVTGQKLKQKLQITGKNGDDMHCCGNGPEKPVIAEEKKNKRDF